MHGRKGPKADKTVAGSSVKFLHEGEKLPLVVIKDGRRRGDDLKGSYRFGVCFDSSPSSEKALAQVISMMAPQDKLAIITCREPGIDSNLESKIKAICGKTKYNHADLEREVNHTIFQRIKQYLKDEMNDDNYIDFVAVGSKGVGSS